MQLSLNRFQENLWKFANLYPTHFYNLGLSFRLSENLNPHVLYDACALVVDSVDILHSVLSGDEKSGIYFDTDNEAGFIFDSASCTENECEVDMMQFTHRPFQLDKQYPIRMKLYSLPDRSFMLNIVFHHICIDGVSVIDLLEMIAQAYNEKEAGNSNPELEIPSWQASVEHMQLGSNDLKQINLDYWKNVFVDKKLETVFQETSAPTSDYEFQSEVFELGEELVAQLNHAARKYRTTAFSMILATWAFVLHRLTGQKQIFVDTTFNRRPPKSKNLIGFFVNNFPFMADFESCRDVTSLLQELTAQRKELKVLQQYSISEIFHELTNDKDASVAGRATVGVNFIGWSNSLHIPFHTVDCSFHKRLDNSMALDLLLEVEPTPVGLSRICYRTGFSVEYIRMLTGAFVEALRSFTSEGEHNLAKISIASQAYLAELQQIYDERQDELQPVKESMNEYFVRVAHACPDRVALVYDDKSVSYRELLETCTRNAHLLRSNFNRNFGKPLPVGERIGIYTTNKLQAIIWALSILRAGGTYVNLDVAYPKDRIVFVTQDCDIRLVLSDIPEATDVIPSSSRVLSLAGEDEAGESDMLPVVDPSTTAYIIFTSGTTGMPKGVPIQHIHVLNMLQADVFSFPDETIFLQFASLSFDISVWEIFGSLLNGATLVIANEEQRHDIGLLIDLLNQQQISVALIPPVLLARFPRVELPYLKQIWVAGDSTPANVIDYWKQDRIFYNSYGPTETTVLSHACLMDETALANDVGLPFFGVTCYVLDDNQNLVPDYVHGELYIGGGQTTAGYINRPELNAEKLIPNPFATERDRQLGRNLFLYKSGDIISRRPDGHFLFHGRKDFQVKIHGFRVELGEIETLLNRYPEISRSIVQVREIAGDQKLVAYMALNKKVSESGISVTQLRDSLSESLPYYMIPSRWIFLENFPLNVNGKIDTKALPEPETGEVVESEYVSSKTASEQLLERIVSEVCQMDKVSVEADLFSLGVSSIQVMMIIVQAASEGLELTVSDFYRKKTIREIVKDCKSQACFWVSDEENQADKPVMLLVCGDASFYPDYQYFVSKFEKEYAILVLDSYHTYFASREMMDWDGLVEVYKHLSSRLLSGRVPSVVAGYCIGGEIALSLVQMFADAPQKPALLLLDSFANRAKWNISSFDYPGFSEEIRDKFAEETATLIKSQMITPYDGNVLLVLADKFTKDRIQGCDNQEIGDRVYGQFAENASAWLALMPQCRIEKADADHWHILDGKGVDVAYDFLSGSR